MSDGGLIDIYQTAQRITRHGTPSRDKWGKVTTPGITSSISARIEHKEKLVVNDDGERVVSTARAYVTPEIYNAHSPEVLYDFNSGGKRRVIAREQRESFDAEYGVLHFE